ncbi:MAG: hypothetical protein PHW10_02540 [Candidatus Peribacteraceae bacterium]|nr:hypothetical protein [Candidatus Peribacteraceae bacterium]
MPEKQPCHSFEHLVEEAQRAPDLDAWVAQQLAHLSAGSLLEYCHMLHQWGGTHADLAREIAQSPSLAAQVVSGSRKLDDGTYVAAEVPQGFITRDDFEMALGYLEIPADRRVV